VKVFQNMRNNLPFGKKNSYFKKFCVLSTYM